MIEINKEVNLEQLDKELNNKGLIATLDDNKKIIEVGLAENNDATEEQLKFAIEAHIAIDEIAVAEEAKAAEEAAKQQAFNDAVAAAVAAALAAQQK
jgi:hypothetical protein